MNIYLPLNIHEHVIIMHEALTFSYTLSRSTYSAKLTSTLKDIQCFRSVKVKQVNGLVGKRMKKCQEREESKQREGMRRREYSAKILFFLNMLEMANYDKIKRTCKKTGCFEKTGCNIHATRRQTTEQTNFSKVSN